MTYQAADAERGLGSYDPVADLEPIDEQSGRRVCRKPVWIAGLVVCGVVALSSQASVAVLPQSAAGDYDASQYMPKANLMACLQSSCNDAVGALAMRPDTQSRGLVSCLNAAGDGVSGRTCFSHISMAGPATHAVHTCAVCKHCIPGDVSPKRCASLPQGDNDLRGPPPATGSGANFDYSKYTSTQNQASAWEQIPETTATWDSFQTNNDNPGVVPEAVIPTDIMPAVAKEVSSDLSHADDEISAGLAHADLKPSERAKIEDKVSHRLARVNKEVHGDLSRADDEILRANKKTSAELSHVNDKVSAELSRADRDAAAGLHKADDEIEQHVDKNPNVPAEVPSYIPPLGSNHPVTRSIPTAAWEKTIDGTHVLWSKYLPEKDEPREAHVHGGDALEYVPTNLAVQPQVDAKKEVAKKKAPQSSKQANEMRLMNACMQMNCNSAIAGLGSGMGSSAQTSGLARCIQDSKTKVAANGCFKQFPSPQGEALQTCMICKHCLAGSVAPDKCLALGGNPNDIRGP